MVDHLVANIDARAGLLKDRTPASSHIVNDKAWIQGQCKKKLLQQTDRVALAQEAGELHFALFNANRCYGILYRGTASIGEEFDEVSAAAGVYESAKSQVILISHLHVCQDLKDAEQLKEAKALHLKDVAVPFPVKEFIRTLALKADTLEAAISPAVKKRKMMQ